MKKHCILLRIHKTLAVIAFVLAAVVVGILLLSPKYFRHAEPEVEISIIGVPGAKVDTGSNFWRKSR